MSSKLKIVVVTEIGVENVLAIDNPKEDVTANEVKEFMKIMQDEKIHTFKGGQIERIKGAKIVTTNKKKFPIY